MRFSLRRSRPDAEPEEGEQASGAHGPSAAAYNAQTGAPAPLIPLSPEEIALVRASIAAVAPVSGEVTVYFYAILFTRHPEVRQLFPANMDVQRDRLLRGLLRIVDLVDDPANLTRFCARLGRDHRKFGALDGHYPAVGSCLLDALARFAGPAWNEQVAHAWGRAYNTVAEVMIRAAAADAQRGPAVWHSEIVRHRPFGHGIAEVTVRPERPYPYLAGQFVSMETPWQPKAWRYYSPANAPRADGTLTFHIRAVEGGQVSPALVHCARPGDVVRLGAAQGEMTLEARTESNLVCIAGGTGLAPIRALVEQAARNGEQNYVDVFLGARTGDELYGLDDMLRMSQRHHWLTVRAAVSQQQIPGLQGSLPDVLADFGPWYRHEAFLSGPSEMVSAAAQALTHQGVSRSRIHYDPFDVPVLESALSSPF